MAGLARWERVSGPWRDSKLRLVVLMTLSCFPKCSPPAKKHMEQPDARHSKPARVKMRSRPSASACAFTCMEPGTQMARRRRLTLRPFSTCAAARKSDILALVQEPINAASISVPISGCPDTSPIYSSDLARPSASPGPASDSPGTFAVTATEYWGLLPQVTWGARLLQSTSSSASNRASASVQRVRQ